MKRKFDIIIEKEGAEFEARCREIPDVVASGDSKEDALKKLKEAIIKKLGDNPDAGSAPAPNPVSPPRGPSTGFHQETDV